MRPTAASAGAAILALLALDPGHALAQPAPGVGSGSGGSAGITAAQNRNAQPQGPSFRDILAEDVAKGWLSQDQANQLLDRAQQIRAVFERQARDAGGAIVGNLRANASQYQQDAVDVLQNEQGSGRTTGEGAARSVENLVVLSRSVENNLRLPLETYLNGANELMQRRAAMIAQNPAVPLEERRRITREAERLDRAITVYVPAALDMRQAQLNRVRAEVDNRRGEIAAAYTEMERRYGRDPRQWPQTQRPRPQVVMRTPPPPEPATSLPEPAATPQPAPTNRPVAPRLRVNAQGQPIGPDGRPLRPDSAITVQTPSDPDRRLPQPASSTPLPPETTPRRQPSPPPFPPARSRVQPVRMTQVTRNIDPPLQADAAIVDLAATMARAARDLGRTLGGSGGGGAGGSGGDGGAGGGPSTRATLASQRSFVEGMDGEWTESAFILEAEGDWRGTSDTFDDALEDLDGIVPVAGEVQDAWANFELGGTLTVAELEPIYAGWDIDQAPPGSSGRSFSSVGNSLRLDWTLPAFGALSTQLAADRAAGILAGYATDGWTLSWGELDAASTPVRVTGDGRAAPGTLAAYLRDQYYTRFPSLWDGGLGLDDPRGYDALVSQRALARALYGPLWSDRPFALIRDPDGRRGAFSPEARLAGYLQDLTFDELVGLLLRGGLGGLDRLLAQPFNVVLAWGANAFDVDLHMTGPTGSQDASRFHIFYAAQGSLETLPFAQLIRDCICASGSEVILTSQLNQGGVYRISAFNFGNQSTSSTQLSTSADLQLLIVRGGVARNVGNGTTVDGGTIIFRGQPTPGRPGNTWVGVEIDPANGEIRFVDRIDNSVNGDGPAGAAARAGAAAPAAPAAAPPSPSTTRTAFPPRFEGSIRDR